MKESKPNELVSTEDKQQKAGSEQLGRSGYMGIGLAIESVAAGVDSKSYVNGVIETGLSITDGNMNPVKSMLFAQAKMLDTLFYVTLRRAGKFLLINGFFS